MFHSYSKIDLEASRQFETSEHFDITVQPPKLTFPLRCSRCVLHCELYADPSTHYAAKGSLR
jgi:hypothetical protein